MEGNENADGRLIMTMAEQACEVCGCVHPGELFTFDYEGTVMNVRFCRQHQEGIERGEITILGRTEAGCFEVRDEAE
jgi:hypothetical protein